MSILRCPHRARRQSITGRETIPRRSWLPEPMRRRSPFERPRWPNRLSSSEHWRALLPAPKDYRRVARCRARRGGCLPNKLDVSLRDLPGERLVRNAKVERVEPPPLSAIRRHIVMCIFNQPHHGPTYRVRAEANAIPAFIMLPLLCPETRLQADAERRIARHGKLSPRRHEELTPFTA